MRIGVERASRARRPGGTTGEFEANGLQVIGLTVSEARHGKLLKEALDNVVPPTVSGIPGISIVARQEAERHVCRPRAENATVAWWRKAEPVLRGFHADDRNDGTGRSR